MASSADTYIYMLWCWPSDECVNDSGKIIMLVMNSDFSPILDTEPINCQCELKGLM